VALCAKGHSAQQTDGGWTSGSDNAVVVSFQRMQQVTDVTCPTVHLAGGARNRICASRAAADHLTHDVRSEGQVRGSRVAIAKTRELGLGKGCQTRTRWGPSAQIWSATVTTEQLPRSLARQKRSLGVSFEERGLFANITVLKKVPSPTPSFNALAQRVMWCLYL
jgi:hypothetical protein